jgi:hypothetical protein
MLLSRCTIPPLGYGFLHRSTREVQRKLGLVEENSTKARKRTPKAAYGRRRGAADADLAQFPGTSMSDRLRHPDAWITQCHLMSGGFQCEDQRSFREPLVVTVNLDRSPERVIEPELAGMPWLDLAAERQTEGTGAGRRLAPGVSLVGMPLGVRYVAT